MISNSTMILHGPSRRKRTQIVAVSPPPPPPPPPVALMLVAASFQSGIQAVQLGFDRAVNVDAFNSSALTVLVANGDDSASMMIPSGSPTLIDPQTVQISLNLAFTTSGEQTQLNAGSDTGIVAVDDGGTWAGVVELGLPFP